jgi:2'-5' RNA ligase
VRLFIAINLKGKTGEALVAVQERLRGRAAAGNFSRRETLHLTMAFLGESPESQVPPIRRIIGDPGLSDGGGPLRLNLRRSGCFRHSGKELWWIGPAEDDPGLPRLLALRERLAAALEGAGVSFDKRPFRAHITLGRDIRGLPIDWAADPPPGLVPEEGVPCELNRLSLMKSGHSGGLLVYTEIFGVEISGGAGPADNF